METVNYILNEVSIDHSENSYKYFIIQNYKRTILTLTIFKKLAKF